MIKNTPELTPENKPEKAIPITQALWRFILHTVNLREGADIKGTIERIEKDIDFKGANLWILICSIIIASIGLNVNSIPAIIGAMLISPLMGPILGLGLSIGTYDWGPLKRSLKALGVTVFASVLTSYIYFSISPLKEIQVELLSRTKPTILDVMIALFGGIAGIVAGSRSVNNNVIPGVAIATALMPPLCTAGFGLATGNYAFFLGAIYLFFINSVFICLATILVVRFMRFPLASWVDQKKKKQAQFYITFIVLLVAIPSGVIFWEVIKESVFTRNAQKFISEEVIFEDCEIINQQFTYTDSTSTIEIFLIGATVNQDEQKRVTALLPKYELNNTELIFYQNKDASNEIESMAGKVSKELRIGIIEDLYEKNAEILENKDTRISFLEDRLIGYERDSLPLNSVRKEVYIQYEHLEKFSLAFTIDFDKSGTRDTIPTGLIKWDDYINQHKRRSLKADQETKLRDWLKVRLQLDTLRIITY
jgi:uncharacterized hydrophobic protein (TIGR00271 family)